MSPPPVVIVLAAGRGSRFRGASHKLSQPLGGGTVLGRTVGHAIASGLPVVVVTTPLLEPEVAGWVAARDTVIVPEVRHPPSGELGMGYSIAAGVTARADAGGWLVLPGDLPLVRPDTLRRVAAGLAQHPVVYAQHRGRRGHPVGFAAELFPELIALKGDEGARRVIARYPSAGIEAGDPGVLLDIDTEADLEAARRTLDDAASPAG